MNWWDDEMSRFKQEMRRFKQGDKITVYLTPSLRQGLEEAFRKTGESRSGIIRKALDEHLTKMEAVCLGKKI